MTANVIDFEARKNQRADTHRAWQETISAQAERFQEDLDALIDHAKPLGTILRVANRLRDFARSLRRTEGSVYSVQSSPGAVTLIVGAKGAEVELWLTPNEALDLAGHLKRCAKQAEVDG